MDTTAVVCAYSLVGREALAGLLEAGVRVLGLFTYPHAPEDGWFEPPADLARREGIPVWMEPRFNEDAVFERIRGLRPDFLFSFYFREMIQGRFLDLPPRGAYNLHGSLLPRYRGRAPVNWVLVKGEPETGVTLHLMTPKPDDGDIVGQARIPMEWDETALSLTRKVAAAGRGLVAATVADLAAGRVAGISQKTLGPSSYFGGRKPEDGELRFELGAGEAFNLVRAVADPWPNAFLRLPRGVVQVPWALPSPESCPPGHFRPGPLGPLVGFSDGSLVLHSLRHQGQRLERPTEMAALLRELGLPESP
ncbi:MAG: formyltransferase [Acidobacteria bacterium]|nr:formyltransferase [Acidobacteriota bacterium]